MVVTWVRLLAAATLLFAVQSAMAPATGLVAGIATDGGTGLGEAYLAEDGFALYTELDADVVYPGDGSSPGRYNPTGDDIVIDRVSDGRYVVTVTASDTEFIPTVTAYGTTGTYCNIASWFFPGTSATVRCFDATGTSTDSAFTMRWTSTDDDAAMFVRANGTICCDTNPWGAVPTGVKNDVGDYTVTVPGAPNFESGHVQVTAQGVNSNHCKVRSMAGADVDVVCFDATGAAVDNAFTLLRIGSVDDAYAWADDETAATEYTTAPGFSHNPQGTDPTSVQIATGIYTVTFPDHLVDFGGSVAVTAHGDSSHRCNVVSWTTRKVLVACNDVTGAAVDSQFNVLFTRFRTCDSLPANIEMGNGGAPTTGDDIIVGTSGDDTILTLNGNDLVCAGDGNDFVQGSGGADTIYGEGGNDTVSGNADDDVLSGGEGDDTIFAGSGDDTVTGGAGNDVLGGSSGVDQLAGEAGDDTMSGGSGDDGTISGGDDNDAVNGGTGNDNVVTGGAGDDTVSGNGGNDTVSGDAGNDEVRGGQGNDLVLGGDDDDFVAGNTGIDTCDGQAGTDTAAPNCETVLNVP